MAYSLLTRTYCTCSKEDVWLQNKRNMHGPSYKKIKHQFLGKYKNYLPVCLVDKEKLHLHPLKKLRVQIMSPQAPANKNCADKKQNESMPD